MGYSILENSIFKKQINVFDTATRTNSLKYNAGKQIAKILVNNSGTHTISISKFDNTIIYYNLTTSTINRTITSIPKPMDGIISNNGNFLYVISQNSSLLYRVSLINPAAPILGIPLSIKPLKLVTNSTNLKIYLAGLSGKIAVVDTATFTETSSITLPNATRPHIVADLKISPNDSSLIYLDRYAREVLSINLSTMAVSTIDLNIYSTRCYLMSCVISADSEFIYVLGRYRYQSYVVKLKLTSGTLTYLDIQTLSVLVRRINISDDGNSLYLSSTLRKTIQIRSTGDLNIITTINLTKPPYYFFIDSVTDIAYALDKNSGLITAINTSTNSISYNSTTTKNISSAAAANI